MGGVYWGGGGVREKEGVCQGLVSDYGKESSHAQFEFNDNWVMRRPTTGQAPITNEKLTVDAQHG